MNKGLLTLFCGKMGAGKSTKASEIARKESAVLLSEDEWLASLYPNSISSINDYVKYSNQLKPQIKKLFNQFCLREVMWSWIFQPILSLKEIGFGVYSLKSKLHIS